LGYRAIKNTGRVIAPTPVMKLLWKRRNQQTASLLIHYRNDNLGYFHFYNGWVMCFIIKLKSDMKKGIPRRTIIHYDLSPFILNLRELVSSFKRITYVFHPLTVSLLKD